ncbi:2-hydroxyglutaryl-CoA dehydratase [candidate division WOR-3 bacterium]|nr:2-hydroxyglutaryl-CoA dehydratase [candidate division WOR-3 bacterium]
MIAAGIDVGSVNTKLVLLDRSSGDVLCEKVVPTGPRPRDTAQRVLAECGRELKQEVLGFGGSGVLGAGFGTTRLVATGYARQVVEGAAEAITEVKAAALGIRHWRPQARTVVDIGGQDSKVLALDESGKVRDFVMNDRCAAGTGHFLSVTAKTLSVPLADFGRLSLESRRPVPLTSLCVVMAESEILSLLAADTPVADVIAGLHEALARRIANLAARLRVEPEVVFTGGVAQNPGMQAALARAFGLAVTVAPKPFLAAAMGAALASAPE